MNQQQVNDEIDLREYIDVLVRRWKTIVFVIIVMTIAAFVYSKMQKPIYETSTTLLLRGSGSSSSLSQYAGLAGMLGVNLSGGGW